MTTRIAFFAVLAAGLFVACSKEDTEAPLLMPTPDYTVHYRMQPYTDPGCDVADALDCLQQADIVVSGIVDVSRYGTYQLDYTATDDAGNVGYTSRTIDVILPIEDYYNQTWKAFDTCTSGNYFYDGLIQDCDCDEFAVTVGNISNFGLSASFTLPISGTYNHMLNLDTVKAGVTFFGLGTMSPMADSIYWDYLVIDSVQTDVCRSVWVK